MSEPFARFRGLGASLDGIPLACHPHGSWIRLAKMRRPFEGFGPWPLLCSSSVIPHSIILRRLFEPALQVSLRNLWNVGGHGLGFFPRKIFQICL